MSSFLRRFDPRRRSLSLIHAHGSDMAPADGDAEIIGIAPYKIIFVGDNIRCIFDLTPQLITFHDHLRAIIIGEYDDIDYDATRRTIKVTLPSGATSSAATHYMSWLQDYYAQAKIGVGLSARILDRKIVMDPYTAAIAAQLGDLNYIGKTYVLDSHCTLLITNLPPGLQRRVGSTISLSISLSHGYYTLMSYMDYIITMITDELWRIPGVKFEHHV